jgi:hypothetical protein
VASGDLARMHAFASGGGIGLVYLWMLQWSVDTMGRRVGTVPGRGFHSSIFTPT